MHAESMELLIPTHECTAPIQNRQHELKPTLQRFSPAKKPCTMASCEAGFGTCMMGVSSIFRARYAHGKESSIFKQHENPHF